MKRKPDFIIIGAMKCATTSIHVQLTRQPGIFVHGPGELEFFSDDEVYARGMDWYESLFDRAGIGDLCGERSTEYTKLPTYPNTVSRMHHDLPDARLIYVMRHPLDRLVSHYMHEWLARRVSTPIETAATEHPELVGYGCYDLQLEPYLQAFGRARILPVFFERLVAEPQQELERICRFIGYSAVPRWDHGLGAQNVSLERVRRGPLWQRVLDVPALQTLRRRLIPERARSRVRKLWQIAERPEIARSQREDLCRVFDGDLARLGAKLGVDLSCENFKAVVASRPLEWTA